MDTMTTATKYEDDSASEYTDPNNTDNNSAPTELLAEFLTSIMRKEWKNALKHCKLSNNYFYCVSIVAPTYMSRCEGLF